MVGSVMMVMLVPSFGCGTSGKRDRKSCEGYAGQKIAAVRDRLVSALCANRA
jgi:hypothetical protein